VRPSSRPIRSQPTRYPAHRRPLRRSRTRTARPLRAPTGAYRARRPHAAQGVGRLCRSDRTRKAPPDPVRELLVHLVRVCTADVIGLEDGRVHGLHLAAAGRVNGAFMVHELRRRGRTSTASSASSWRWIGGLGPACIAGRARTPIPDPGEPGGAESRRKSRALSRHLVHAVQSAADVGDDALR
jgi:hypothetical protein